MQLKNQGTRRKKAWALTIWKYSSKNTIMGKMSREMVPWFRALAILLEVPGYTFSTSMVAHAVYSSRYGEIQPHLLADIHTAKTLRHIK